MTMRWRSSRLFLPLYIFVFVALHTYGQNKKLPLASENTATPSEELKFNLPVSSAYPLTLPINFVRVGTEEPPKNVTLTLTVFSGPQNEPFFVAFANQLPSVGNCSKGNIPAPIDVPVSEGRAVLLRTTFTVYCNPPTPGPYSGRLIVTADGYQSEVFKITLTKAAIKPAILTLSRKDGTILLSRSLCDHISSLADRHFSWCRWGSKPQPQVSTNAWDKNGLSSVNGLSARLEQLSTTSNHNLDSGQNLTFFLDSKEFPGFDTPDPDDIRRIIPAGGRNRSELARMISRPVSTMPRCVSSAQILLTMTTRSSTSF